MPGRLIAVKLDEATIPRGNPDQEHERRVAIYDLVDANSFSPAGFDDGKFTLLISLIEGRLVLDVRNEDDVPLMVHILSLTPLRKTVRDYHSLCASYYDAIRTATHGRIETIDMARRALHNEGATLLGERLAGKLDFDHHTARRLFTLVSALAWRG